MKRYAIAIGAVLAVVTMYSQYGRVPGSGRKPPPILGPPATPPPTCCMSITWTFMPDITDTDGSMHDETAMFTLGVSDLPAYSKAFGALNGPISTYHFTTVITKDEFFKHTLSPQVAYGKFVSRAQSRADVHGFAGVDGPLGTTLERK